MYFVPGCCNCGSGCGPATVDATALCGGTGSPLTGFTFDLRDSGDTTTLATQTGSSASFTGLDGTLSYKVRVSKTGYHTKTSGTLTPGCGGTSTTAVSTWPTPYNLPVNVKIKTCNHAGATVAVTGDATGSGTTDSSGNVTLSLSSTSTSVTQSLSYTVTPASGYGAAVKTGSWSINACSPTTQNVALIPSAGHVDVACNGRYLPEDFTWTDDYGSATISFGGFGASGWGGSYTYTSSHAVKYMFCLDNPVEQNFSEQTADITVYCRLEVVSGACGSTTFRFRRDINTANALNCVESGAVLHCQPRDDDHPSSVHPAATGTYYVDESYSCPASVDIDAAFGPTPATCGSGVEETTVSINVAGTIT